MKHSFIFCLLLWTFGQSISAQNYCLSYEIIAKTPNVVLKVSIAGSTSFNLGEANLVFNYNNSAMYPAGLSSNTLTSAYSAPAVTDPANGVTSIHFDFTGTSGQGLPISTSPTEIARVVFPIRNAALKTGFSGNSTYCIVYNDVNTTTPLTIGSPCPVLDVTIQEAVLPLEWLDFQARATTDKGFGKVNLDWTTTSEHNVLHFVVERSSDGKKFDKIGNTVAAKNTSGKNTYHVLDEKPLAGLSFYRIREVDSNGQESFSAVRSVVLDADKTVFAVYPNPKAKEDPLSIQTNFSDNYTFNLFDATGKLIYSRPCKGNVQLEDLNLATGFYLFDCTTPKDKVMGKIIVPN